MRWIPSCAACSAHDKIDYPSTCQRYTIAIQVAAEFDSVSLLSDSCLSNRMAFQKSNLGRELIF